MSRDQSIQASGFYVAGLLCFVLAVLKLTMRWSWWRVLLPLWALVGHSALYLAVGFLWLTVVRLREDEDNEPNVVGSDGLIGCQVASLVCVLIFMDNVLRWAGPGGGSHWFWLCSGKVEMIVLFGVLSVVAQFVYWSGIIKTA